MAISRDKNVSNKHQRVIFIFEILLSPIISKHFSVSKHRA